jgi:NhaC family Na+:H+ antiporter
MTLLFGYLNWGINYYSEKEMKSINKEESLA